MRERERGGRPITSESRMCEEEYKKGQPHKHIYNQAFTDSLPLNLNSEKEKTIRFILSMTMDYGLWVLQY